MTATDSRETIRIGVFIPAGCQLLDMACVDVLGTMSHEYFTVVADMVPGPIAKLAPNVKISCTCIHSLGSEPLFNPPSLSRHINSSARRAYSPDLVGAYRLHAPSLGPDGPAGGARRRPRSGAGPGNRLWQDARSNRLARGARGPARDRHPERVYWHLPVRRRGAAKRQEGLRAEGTSAGPGGQVQGCRVGWRGAAVGERREFLELRCVLGLLTLAYHVQHPLSRVL